MHARIFSVFTSASVVFASVTGASIATAQAPAGGVMKDPVTGQAVVPVRRTIARPVQETRMVTRQQSTFTPRVVSETRPTTRTTFYPTTQTTVQPYVANRWNPFARPSIAYRFVPQTVWKSQTDVVDQTTLKTEYVAETKTFQVPETVTKMKQEEQLTYQPVGVVKPITAGQPAVDPAQAALAARLRPLGSNERVVPYGSQQGSAYANSAVASLPRTTSVPRIASSSIAGNRIATRGRMQSDPPARSPGQSGQRATDLTRRAQNLSQPLPMYR